MTPRRFSPIRRMIASSWWPVPNTSDDDVLGVQPDGHVLAVADIAEYDRQMLHGVPRQRVGEGLRLAAGRLDVRAGDALDQRLLALAVGDEVGDRNLLQAMLGGECRDLRAALHAAVVVDQFGDHADLRQAGELAQIDRRLGMAGAHEHAALARDQREDVTRPQEIRGADVGIGEIADGQRPVVSRNAGRRAVLEVDADGEGGGVCGIIVGDHRREV